MKRNQPQTGDATKKHTPDVAEQPASQYSERLKARQAEELEQRQISKKQESARQFQRNKALLLAGIVVTVLAILIVAPMRFKAIAGEEVDPVEQYLNANVDDAITEADSVVEGQIASQSKGSFMLFAESLSNSSPTDMTPTEYVLRMKYLNVDSASVDSNTKIDDIFATEESTDKVIAQFENSMPLLDPGEDSPYFVAMVDTADFNGYGTVLDYTFAMNDDYGNVIDDVIYDPETGITYVPKYYYDKNAPRPADLVQDGTEEQITTTVPIDEAQPVVPDAQPEQPAQPENQGQEPTDGQQTDETVQSDDSTQEPDTVTPEDEDVSDVSDDTPVVSNGNEFLSDDSGNQADTQSAQDATDTTDNQDGTTDADANVTMSPDAISDAPAVQAESVSAGEVTMSLAVSSEQDAVSTNVIGTEDASQATAEDSSDITADESPLTDEDIQAIMNDTTEPSAEMEYYEGDAEMPDVEMPEYETDAEDSPMTDEEIDAINEALMSADMNPYDRLSPIQGQLLISYDMQEDAEVSIPVSLVSERGDVLLNPISEVTIPSLNTSISIPVVAEGYRDRLSASDFAIYEGGSDNPIFLTEDVGHYDAETGYVVLELPPLTITSLKIVVVGEGFVSQVVDAITQPDAAQAASKGSNFTAWPGTLTKMDVKAFRKAVSKKSVIQYRGNAGYVGQQDSSWQNAMIASSKYLIAPKDTKGKLYDVTFSGRKVTSWRVNNMGTKIYSDGSYDAVMKNLVQQSDRTVSRAMRGPDGQSYVTGSLTGSFSLPGDLSGTAKVGGLDFTGIKHLKKGGKKLPLMAAGSCVHLSRTKVADGWNRTNAGKYTNANAIKLRPLLVVTPDDDPTVSGGGYVIVGFVTKAMFTQNMTGVYKFALKGTTVHVKKTSTIPSITDKDSNSKIYAKNCQGAVYGMWKTRAEAEKGTKNNAYKLFTVNDKGTSPAQRVTAGTYYFKELTAPKGYELDSKITSATIKVGATNEFAATDRPILTNWLTLIKKSSNEAVVKADKTGKYAQNCAGAVYGVYDTEAEARSATPKKPGKPITRLTVGKNGTSNEWNIMSWKTDKKKYNRYFYLKEIVAPKGFKLNTGVIKAYVKVNEHKTVTATDEPEITESLTLKKVSANKKLTDSDTKTYAKNCEGAVYGVYDTEAEAKNATPKKPGKPITRLTVGKNGESNTWDIIKWSGLKGKYDRTFHLKEIKAPKGFKLNPETISVSVKANEHKTVTATDEPEITGGLTLKKSSSNKELTDANTDVYAKNCAGAVYGVYDTEDEANVATPENPGTPVTKLTIKENGESNEWDVTEWLRSKKVTSYTLYLKEIVVPKGFKLNTKAIPALVEVNKDQVVTTTDEPETTEWLTLKKSSSNKELTDADPDTYAKNCEGAVYGVYDTEVEANAATPENPGNPITKLTVGEDGTSNTWNITEWQTDKKKYGRNFYLKELVAPKGYKLNTKTIAAPVEVNKNNEVTTTDEPAAGNWLKLKKTSSAPAVTDADATTYAKNCEGAVYGVYDTEAEAKGATPDNQGSPITRLTVGANGETEEWDIATWNTDKAKYNRTFYLKELVAPKGFKLNTAVIDAKVGINQHVLVEATDEPEIHNWLKLKKTSTNPALTTGNPAYAQNCEGAVYGVYDTEDDAKNKKGEITKLTVGANGETEEWDIMTWDSKKEKHSRIFYLRELTAPKGYKLNDAIIEAPVKINEHAIVEAQDEPEVTSVKVRKLDAETKKSPTGTFEFALYDANKNELTAYGRKTVTGSNEAEWAGLPYGSYFVRETAASYPYKVNGEFIAADAASQTVTVTVEDTQRRGEVVLVKKDAKDNSPIAGTKFILKANQDVTSPDGTARHYAGQPVTVSKTSDGVYAYKPNATKTIKGTDKDGNEAIATSISTVMQTAADGSLKVTGLYLTDGNTSFQFEEMAPAGGYVLSDKPLVLTIGKDETKDVISVSGEFKNEGNSIDIYKKALKDDSPIAGVSIAIWDAKNDVKVTPKDGHDFIAIRTPDSSADYKPVIVKRNASASADVNATVTWDASQNVWVADSLAPSTTYNIEMGGRTVKTLATSATGGVDHYGRYSGSDSAMFANGWLDQGALPKSDEGVTVKVTDAEGHIHMDKIAPGDYTIAELKPAGTLHTTYLVDTNAHHFNVNQETGLIKDSCDTSDGYHETDSTKYAINKSFLFKDDVTKLRVSKREVTGGPEVPGATLTLTSYENNDVIDEWVSAAEPHYIEGLKPGTYWLIERMTPNNYDQAEAIKFTVLPTGEIQHVEMLDSPITIDADIDKRQEIAKPLDERHMENGDGKNNAAVTDSPYGYYDYSIDFRNNSNTWVDEFTIDDPLELVSDDLARVTGISTPQAWQDYDGKMNVWYKTNKEIAATRDNAKAQGEDATLAAESTSSNDNGTFSTFPNDGKRNNISDAEKETLSSVKVSVNGNPVLGFDPDISAYSLSFKDMGSAYAAVSGGIHVTDIPNGWSYDSDKENTRAASSTNLDGDTGLTASIGFFLTNGTKRYQYKFEWGGSWHEPAENSGTDQATGNVQETASDVKQSSPGGSNATRGDGHVNSWLDDPTAMAKDTDKDGRIVSYDGWRLWQADVPTTVSSDLDVKSLGLSDGEYVTAIRLEYGRVEAGFTSRTSDWSRELLKDSHDDLNDILSADRQSFENADGAADAAINATSHIVNAFTSDASKEAEADLKARSEADQIRYEKILREIDEYNAKRGAESSLPERFMEVRRQPAFEGTDDAAAKIVASRDAGKLSIQAAFSLDDTAEGRLVLHKAIADSLTHIKGAVDDQTYEALMTMKDAYDGAYLVNDPERYATAKENMVNGLCVVLDRIAETALAGRVHYAPAILHMQLTDKYVPGTELRNSARVDAYRNGGGKGLEGHDEDEVRQNPKDRELKIGTTLTTADGQKIVDFDEDEMTEDEINATEIEFVDTVTYSGVRPGVEYTMTGELHIKRNGVDAGVVLTDGEPVKTTVRFTPENESGTVEIPFKATVASFDRYPVVAYEELRISNLDDDETGDETDVDNPILAEHKDINDAGQTVNFTSHASDIIRDASDIIEEIPEMPKKVARTFKALSIPQTGDAVVIEVVAAITVAAVTTFVVLRRRNKA